MKINKKRAGMARLYNSVSIRLFGSNSTSLTFSILFLFPSFPIFLPFLFFHLDIGISSHLAERRKKRSNDYRSNGKAKSFLLNIVKCLRYKRVSFLTKDVMSN